jgi:hypothetical protein
MCNTEAWTLKRKNKSKIQAMDMEVPRSTEGKNKK